MSGSNIAEIDIAELTKVPLSSRGNQGLCNRYDPDLLADAIKIPRSRDLSSQSRNYYAGQV